jgi:hypothetical protein
MQSAVLHPVSSRFILIFYSDCTTVFRRKLFQQNKYICGNSLKCNFPQFCVLSVVTVTHMRWFERVVDAPCPAIKCEFFWPLWILQTNASLGFNIYFPATRLSFSNSSPSTCVFSYLAALFTAFTVQYLYYAKFWRRRPWRWPSSGL